MVTDIDLNYWALNGFDPMRGKKFSKDARPPNEQVSCIMRDWGTKWTSSYISHGYMRDIFY